MSCYLLERVYRQYVFNGGESVGFVKKVLKICSIALIDSDVECLINSLSRILRSVLLGMTALFSYKKIKNYSLK